MKTRTTKIFLDGNGSFLGRGEGCLIVRDRKGNVEKYPLFENRIDEVHIRIGNSVSSGALATLAFWNVDLLILTQRGNPVAYLKSLEDDSHVKTRIAQYEALKNGKGRAIAKQIVLAKIEGQNYILRKVRVQAARFDRNQGENCWRRFQRFEDRLEDCQKQAAHDRGTCNREVFQSGLSAAADSNKRRKKKDVQGF